MTNQGHRRLSFLAKLNNKSLLLLHNEFLTFPDQYFYFAEIDFTYRRKISNVKPNVSKQLNCNNAVPRLHGPRSPMILVTKYWTTNLKIIGIATHIWPDRSMLTVNYSVGPRKVQIPNDSGYLFWCLHGPTGLRHGGEYGLNIDRRLRSLSGWM